MPVVWPPEVESDEPFVTWTGCKGGILEGLDLVSLLLLAWR